MTTSFDRTVGPKADVQELEYISALHQTGVKTRPTGTISSLDIRRFLMSRHSLEVSHKQACDIVRGLGGGAPSPEIRESIAASVAHRIRRERERAKVRQPSHTKTWTLTSDRETPDPVVTEDDQALRLVEEALNPKIVYLDLVQTTSIILMPTLARMGKLWRDEQKAGGNGILDEEGETDDSLNPKPRDALQLVWQTMCNVIRSKNATLRRSTLGRFKGEMGISFPTLEDDDPYLSPRITPEMIQFLLLENGEIERSNDPHLIRQMVDVATGGSKEGRFDMAAFVRALTLDLEDWDVGCEDRVSTYVSDVCGDPSGNDNYQLLQELISNPTTSDLESILSGAKEADSGVTEIGTNGTNDRAEEHAITMQVFFAKDGVGGIECRETDEMARMLDKRSNFDKEEASEAASGLDVDDYAEAVRELDVDDYADILLRDKLAAFQARLKRGSYRSKVNQPFLKDDLDTLRQLQDKLSSCMDFAPKSPIAAANPPLSITTAQENQTLKHQPKLPLVAVQQQEHAIADTVATMNPDVVKSRRRPADELQASNAESRRIGVIRSGKIIDTVVDAHASTTTLVLVWVTFVWHSVTYASLILSTDAFTTPCAKEDFGCVLGKTIYTWLVLALILSTFGFIVLVPMSFGNHPTKRGANRMFFAAILVAVVIFVPFAVVNTMLYSDDAVENAAEDSILHSQLFHSQITTTTIFGSVLILNYLLHWLIALGRQWKLIEKEHIYRAIGKRFNIISIFSNTSHVIGSGRTKRAATRKVNRMLRNARDMHGPLTSADAAGSSGQGESVRKRTSLDQDLRKEQSDAVFQNYTLRGERTVPAGSFIWTWQKLISGDLFEHEGIWLPSRLMVFQAGQIIFAVSIALALLYFVDLAAEAADRATAELMDSQNATGLYYPQWVLDLVPDGAEVRGALYPAALIAIGVCFVTTALYLPSTVRTILKFRCGKLPSLGGEGFQAARAGADKAYKNTANALYGMLAAAVLFFVLFGLLIFAFIWEITKPYAMLLLAWGIGLTITTVSKMILTSFCRKRFFRALYRIFPGRGNISTLALECWFIGLGGGVLVGRVTQFLLAAAFWIGRIDEPFLATNVALFGYRFDYVPQDYVTEILVHEAHRHPYLERMGAMYLMRLRYRTFGSDAGGCWRQLFVLTLMPWLMKYRVFHEQRCIESVQDQKSEQRVETDENKDALGKMAEELLVTGGEVVDLVDKGAKVGLEALDAGANLISTAPTSSIAHLIPRQHASANC